MIKFLTMFDVLYNKKDQYTQKDAALICKFWEYINNAGEAAFSDQFAFEPKTIQYLEKLFLETDAFKDYYLNNDTVQRVCSSIFFEATPLSILKMHYNSLNCLRGKRMSDIKEIGLGGSIFPFHSHVASHINTVIALVDERIAKLELAESENIKQDLLNLDVVNKRNYFEKNPQLWQALFSEDTIFSGFREHEKNRVMKPTSYQWSNTMAIVNWVSYEDMVNKSPEEFAYIFRKRPDAYPYFLTNK